MKCKNCGEEIEPIVYHGHTWRHVKTCLFICFKDKKLICFKDKKQKRGEKVYFEAEPKNNQEVTA